MRRIVLVLATGALAVLLVSGVTSVSVENLVSGVTSVSVENPATAAFPGENGKIAFASWRNNIPGSDTPDIYTINADGSDLTNVSNNPATDLQPAWSPDGTKLAFVSADRPEHENEEIYVMNADGSNQVNISRNVATDRDPDWQSLSGPTGPQTKADCKNGGYKDFGFKNQGQCIKAVKKAR